MMMIDGSVPTLSSTLREQEFPDSTLSNNANVLVLPDVDTANVTCNALRIAGNGISVGGILLGAAKPVRTLSSSATVRRIVNMTAMASVDAGTRAV